MLRILILTCRAGLSLALAAVVIAGCSPGPDTSSSAQQAPAVQEAQADLTPEQELREYCRVCVVDEGKRMQEYLPSRLDTEVDGLTYRFCNDRCREKFDQTPEIYKITQPSSDG